MDKQLKMFTSQKTKKKKYTPKKILIMYLEFYLEW